MFKSAVTKICLQGDPKSAAANVLEKKDPDGRNFYALVVMCVDGLPKFEELTLDIKKETAVQFVRSPAFLSGFRVPFLPAGTEDARRVKELIREIVAKKIQETSSVDELNEILNWCDPENNDVWRLSLPRGDLPNVDFNEANVWEAVNYASESIMRSTLGYGLLTHFRSVEARMQRAIGFIGMMIQSKSIEMFDIFSSTFGALQRCTGKQIERHPCLDLLPTPPPGGQTAAL